MYAIISFFNFISVIKFCPIYITTIRILEINTIEFNTLSCYMQCEGDIECIYNKYLIPNLNKLQSGHFKKNIKSNLFLRILLQDKLAFNISSQT